MDAETEFVGVRDEVARRRRIALCPSLGRVSAVSSPTASAEAGDRCRAGGRVDLRPVHDAVGARHRFEARRAVGQEGRFTGLIVRSFDEGARQEGLELEVRCVLRVHAVAVQRIDECLFLRGPGER